MVRMPRPATALTAVWLGAWKPPTPRMGVAARITRCTQLTTLEASAWWGVVGWRGRSKLTRSWKICSRERPVSLCRATAPLGGCSQAGQAAARPSMDGGSPYGRLRPLHRRNGPATVHQTAARVPGHGMALWPPSCHVPPRACIHAGVLDAVAGLSGGSGNAHHLVGGGARAQRQQGPAVVELQGRAVARTGA